MKRKGKSVNGVFCVKLYICIFDGSQIFAAAKPRWGFHSSNRKYNEAEPKREIKFPVAGNVLVDEKKIHHRVEQLAQILFLLKSWKISINKVDT